MADTPVERNRATTTRQVSGSLLERYGPWAVVTGASSGIGRAFAEHLAGVGFSLILVARGEDRLKSLAEELGGRHGTACDIVARDLADDASASELIAHTRNRDVGMVVLAAGFGTSGPFLEGDLKSELNMIDLNCRAVGALAHGYGQVLKARGGGTMVLLSSLVAFQGVPGAANYAATKAYVQTLAEGLRIELRAHGIEVLAVAPGPVATGFAARAGMSMSTSQGPDSVAAASLAALGKWGTVRPGWQSLLLESALSPLPRRLRSRILGRVMAGMVA